MWFINRITGNCYNPLNKRSAINYGRFYGKYCIDIINYDPDSKSGFGWYWHTQKDNMENIDRETLKAVGQTVLEVVYNRQKK